MSEETSNMKDIVVYKSVLSQQELKSLCNKAYKNFKTPLQQAQFAISELQKLDRSLENLEVTKEEWSYIKDNKSFVDIARKYNNKKLKELNNFSPKKRKKNINY